MLRHHHIVGKDVEENPDNASNESEPTPAAHDGETNEDESSDEEANNMDSADAAIDDDTYSTTTAMFD